MTSKYDLLITIDPSGGISPGVNNRQYFPGQEIKGFVDLTTFQNIEFDQIRVALLGFSETNFSENRSKDARKWKEKHIFLKQVENGLSRRKLPSGAKEHFNWSFIIPTNSLCEVCGRNELLPAQIDHTEAILGENEVSASITYQIEVSVESSRNGNIFFMEKFEVIPLNTGGAPAVPLDKKKGSQKMGTFAYADLMFKQKAQLFADDPDFKHPVPVEKKKSKNRLRSIFGKETSTELKYDIPLRLEIRPIEPYMSLIPGQPLYVPPIELLFEYPGKSLENPPFKLQCQSSSKLGEFIVRSITIEANFGYIDLTCAGNQSIISGPDRVIYNNNNINFQFDIGTDFEYDQYRNRVGKKFNLVQDIIGAEIDIPLSIYAATFPKHCNQLARNGGSLVFSLEIAPSLNEKPQSVKITAPFSFKGVPIEYAPLIGQPSYSLNDAPPGPPPHIQDIDHQPPSGPPPNIQDIDHQPPSGPPPNIQDIDHQPPSGPPPHIQDIDHQPPSGPPPNIQDIDHQPPSGPPPHIQDIDHQPPSGPPPNIQDIDHQPPSGPPPHIQDINHQPPSGPPPHIQDIDHQPPPGPPSKVSTTSTNEPKTTSGLPTTSLGANTESTSETATFSRPAAPHPHDGNKTSDQDQDLPMYSEISK